MSDQFSNKIVVFDFDGVICDSTNEVIVTSWNSWEKWNGRNNFRYSIHDFSFSEQEIFRPLRPYVRGAGEYYILRRCIEDGISIKNQDEFEYYCNLWKEYKNPFKTFFFEVRQSLQQVNIDEWVKLHPVWEEVITILNTLIKQERLYIATLKDSRSVQLILKYNKVDLRKERILDESQIISKLQALNEICKLEKIDKHELIFIDDNVTHLINPIKNGFRCFMSTWGNIPEDYVSIAKKNDIPMISLKELMKI